MPNSSCLAELLSSYDYVLNSFDNKQCCDILYIDFHKAFDTVPHPKLLFKLWVAGITGSSWYWFKSYLSDRRHHVHVNGVNSKQLPMLSDVPQGSIQSPLLFLIYVNDLPAAIENSPSFLFVDDAKSVHTISSAQDYALIQDDILSLEQWCATWKLTISVHKCVAVKLPLRHANSTDTLYHLDNLVLPFSDHHRDLGVIVCNNCSWSRHYNYICSKAYRS